MVRRNFNDLNLFEPKYDPFIISLDKCTGSFNVLSAKLCDLKERKDINVNKEKKVKIMIKYILCDCNANSFVQQEIQIENGITKHVHVNIKNIKSVKYIIVEILANLFVTIGSI